jgi:hypothetical protein
MTTSATERGADRVDGAQRPPAGARVAVATRLVTMIDVDAVQISFRGPGADTDGHAPRRHGQRHRQLGRLQPQRQVSRRRGPRWHRRGMEPCVPPSGADCHVVPGQGQPGRLGGVQSRWQHPSRGGDDGTVRLWHVTAQALSPAGVLAAGGHNGVYSIAIRPTGTILAAATANGTIELWDVAARRQVIKPIPAAKTYPALACSRDGTTPDHRQRRGYTAMGHRHGTASRRAARQQHRQLLPRQRRNNAEPGR